jgi:hypothetical protein
LQTCDDTLNELRASVDKLHQRLAMDGSDWPALRDRFSVIERSMSLVKDSRTGQLNENALEALPATLEALKHLVSDVSRLAMPPQTARLRTSSTPSTAESTARTRPLKTSI